MIKIALALTLLAHSGLLNQVGTRQPQELVGLRSVKVAIAGLDGFLGERPGFPFDPATVQAEIDQAVRVQLRTAGLEVVPPNERHGENIPLWVLSIRTTELDALTNTPALKGLWLIDVRCELWAQARLDPPLNGAVTAYLRRGESRGSQRSADVRGSVVRAGQFCTESLIQDWKWVTARP